MGRFPGELRVPHQSEGHEVVHRPRRQRQTSDHRPPPDPLARPGSSPGETHPCSQDAWESHTPVDFCQDALAIFFANRKNDTSFGRRAITSACSSDTSPLSWSRSSTSLLRGTSRTSLTECGYAVRSRACACRDQDIFQLVCSKGLHGDQPFRPAVSAQVFAPRAGLDRRRANGRLPSSRGVPLSLRRDRSTAHSDRAERGEIGLLQWKWIDEARQTITFPAEATKNNRSHTFPFGRMAARVLEALPRMGEYVFPPARETRNGVAVRVVNGWSNLKRRFDKSVEGVAAWTLHDLRRTFATNLAALGTPIHVTEKLLTHLSGLRLRRWWPFTIVMPTWTRCGRLSPTGRDVSQRLSH